MFRGEQNFMKPHKPLWVIPPSDSEMLCTDKRQRGRLFGMPQCKAFGDSCLSCDLKPHPGKSWMVTEPGDFHGCPPQMLCCTERRLTGTARLDPYLYTFTIPHITGTVSTSQRSLRKRLSYTQNKNPLNRSHTH